jgi:hypothetical protein
LVETIGIGIRVVVAESVEACIGEEGEREVGDEEVLLKGEQFVVEDVVVEEVPEWICSAFKLEYTCESLSIP